LINGPLVRAHLVPPILVYSYLLSLIELRKERGDKGIPALEAVKNPQWDAL